MQKDEKGRLTFDLAPAETAVFSHTVSGLENTSCTSDNLYENFRTAITANGKFDFAVIDNSLLPVLRNYQNDGVRWMSFLEYFGLGGILADEMGLGKTLQVLALLKTGGYNAPALVVCPKTLVFNLPTQWPLRALRKYL
jgi:SNF2 family DNA or RNA helicase